MAASAATYELRWRLAGSNGAWNLTSVPATASTITIPGLERGQQYDGEARAVSLAGTPSAWVTVTWTVADPSLAPRTPFNLTAVSVADGVALHWQQDTDQPADVDYQIERADASTGPWQELTRVRSLSHTDPVTDGVTRFYRVRAMTFGLVFSSYSNIASAAAKDVSADISTALTTAQNAQATADGKIVSFWQATPPVIGPGANEAGEGDIWFDTDDGNKVYRVVSGAWTVAADDDMAAALAAASDAQATADGKVKTYFQATAPTASAVGDLWFNTTTSKLTRWNGSAWTQNVGDVTLAQLAGSGVNILPDQYSVYEAPSLPAMSTSAAQTVARGTTANDLWAGYPSLAVNLVGAGDPFTWLAPGAVPNIPVTGGKKYIVSAYLSSDAASQTARFLLGWATGNRQALVTTPATINTYGRVSALIDLSDLPSVESIMLGVGHSGAVGTFIRFNGLMLEEQIGTLTTASVYARGTTGGETVNNGIKLADISSDNVLTPGEKPDVIKERDMLVNERSGIEAKATALNITTEKTNYGAAVTALTDYLATLTAPTLWSDLSGNTTVVGSTFRQKFLDVYAARQTLLNKIAVQTLDELPDGSTYGRPILGRLTDGKPWIDFGETIHGNKHLDNIGDGTTYGRPIKSRLNAGKPWIDFSETIHSGKQLDNIADGTNFRRPGAGYVDSSGRVSNVWDDETLVPRTGGYVGGGASRARTGLGADGKVVSGLNDLDRIADGTSYGRPRATQLYAGVLKGLSYGKNQCPNPGFTTNHSGTTLDVRKTTGVLVDDWYVEAAGLGGPYVDTTYGRGGGNSVVSFIPSGFVLGANATKFDQFALVSGIPVVPGQSGAFSFYTRQDYDAAVPSGVTLFAATEVRFYDKNGAGVSGGISITSGSREADLLGTWAVRSKVGTVPANAATARIVVYLFLRNETASAITITGIPLKQGWDDFTFSIASDLDNEVVHGTTYGKVANTDLIDSSGIRRVGLRIAGSGHRIGNQANTPQSLATAYGSVRTTTALSADSSGNVTVNAHTVRYGGFSVAYSGVTNAVTGLSQGVTYAIYCFDEAFAGGARTWFAATSREAAMNQGDGIVVAGEITIPTSGSASGGGGGGMECVATDMLLPCGSTAADVEAGDSILCWDFDADTPGERHESVEEAYTAEQHCTRIETESGAAVVASSQTPMTLRDGSMVAIADMAGHQALVRDRLGRMRWEQVVSAEYVGLHAVRRIRVHQRCYFAGERAGLTIATHNPTQKP